MRRAKWAVGFGVVLGLLGLWQSKGELRAVWAAEPAASGQTEAKPADKSAPEQPSSPIQEGNPTQKVEPAAPSEKTQVSPPAVTPEELDKLVQQLDADAFSDRQTASQRLAELGRAAIDALVRAATSESLEANVRALDILKKHLDSQDAELKKAAKEALEKIAAGPRAPSARRAKDILKAQEEREKMEKLQQQGLNVAGGRIQVMAQAQMIGGPGVRRVEVANNVKTIEGEDKEGKFRIVEDPKEGITVELTRTKEGKEVTEKFQAKNAEELQKKHPQAYEVYKRHSQAGGIIGPVGVAQVQAAPAQVVRRTNVDIASRLLPIWFSEVNRLVTDEAIKDSSRQALEDLKKKSEEARQALEKLERRLQEAIEQKTKEEKAKQEPKSQEEKPQEKPQQKPSASEKQS
jgi:hypothetical protein